VYNGDEKPAQLPLEYMLAGVLIQFFTTSHIFLPSSHLVKIFIYTETPLSPLLSYVHFILLCYLPVMSARHVWHC